MAEWTSVEKGAKDDQGRYMAMVGGQWRPAARVAKNDQGQYLAMFDDAPADTGPVQIPVDPTLKAPAPTAAPPEQRLTAPGSLLGNATDKIEGAVRSAGQGNGLLAKITGAVETALHLGSALTTGSFGMAGGFLEAVGRGQAPEALMQKRGDQYTYMPKSEQGQEQSAAWGKALEPGMAAMGHPELAGMAHLGMGTVAQDKVVQPVVKNVVQPIAQAGREAKAAVGNAGLDAAAGMVKVNPQKLANAGAAVDAGMDVPLHTIGDRGAVVKGAGEAMGQIPLSGSKHESNIKAFNKQVIAHINPEETSAQLTPQVMDRALKTAGKTIGENMRSVEVPQADLAPAMNSLRDGLATATVDAEKVVRAYLAQIDVKASENGGVIPGAALRELDTKIGEQLRSSGGQHPDIESRIAELQDAIRDAAEGRMTPEMADATKAARQRYAKTMSLVPAYADIRKQGYLDPGKLMTLVGKSPLSKRLMATGNGGAWQDLAAAGELVQPEGSALRGRLIGGGAGIGAGGLYAATGSMTSAGAVAGAAGVLGTANLYNRVGPKIVKKLVERERKRGAPPPEAPPPELTTEPGAGGPGPAPRGGTVLPAPDDGPLGPAGPDLTTSPGAGGIELPRELSPAEQALSARAPVLDELTIGERAPSRIIKSRKGEVERRGMKDVPAVPGRPDVPEQMNVGAPAEVGRTAADNAALIEDQTVLAREKQGYSLAPGKEAPPPVGEAKEVGTYDPRLAEIERLRAQTDNPAVRDALGKRETEVKRAMKAEDAARKREQDATALEDAIRKTEDPEIKAVLRAEADKLREKIPTPEVTEGMPADKQPKAVKLPVGKAKEVAAPEPITPAPRPKLAEPEVTEINPERVEGGEPIPRGEATEVDPVPVGQADDLLPVGESAEIVPVGESTEMLPAGDAIDGPPPMDRVPMPPAPKPRMIERGVTTLPAAKIRKVAKDHGLGTKDMERAKAVAAALEKDESAVVAATTKGHTPAAFDAEIERINRSESVKEPWNMTREEAAKDYPGDEYDKMINRASDLGDLTYAEADRKSRVKLGGGKKLWAQTRAEIAAEGKGHTKAAVKDRVEWNKLKGSEGYAQWRINSNAKAAQRNVESTKQYTKALLGVHKERVEEALVAGHDVPPEVLNDYPDLKAKYASQPIQAAESSPRPEPRGQDATTRAEQPRPDGAATARADKPKAAPAAEAVSKEQRQAAINAETLENRPDAVEVAQPTKGKRVRVETVTLSGPKTVTANLYELPGYKGPQLAVAEYKSSRGQGYKVYLPKSGAFIHDSNGVQPLNEALKQAVLRIDHARQTLGAKAVPTPTEALTTVKSLLQPAPRKATVPTDRKPLIARKNSEILADLNKQIDERLREAAGDIDELEARTDADPKVAQALKAYKDAVKEAGDAIVVRRLVPLSAQWKQYQATGKTKLTEAQKLYDELQAAEAKVGAAETERDIRSRDLRDARNAAGARVTVKSGGTSYTVANTTEALARLRDAITKDQGFKDGKTPKVGQKATGGVTTKRAPKAVVQDFVADGDFENAQALAEHYGIDIKAGMDAKQKRAYQDWLDSRDLH